MYGITIEQAPMDWEILQQEDGFADMVISGGWAMHPAALDVGVAGAAVVVRLMDESNNHQVIPWQRAKCVSADDYASGSFKITLHVPAGGLYRLETALDTRSVGGTYHWMFRGDARFHLGVGDLFVIAGQSNAAGFGKDEAVDAPDLAVHMYRSRGSWDIATHPLNDSTGAPEYVANIERRITGTSPFLAFGKTYSICARWPVGLIPCAAGGAPMQRWLPKDGGGDLYINMLDTLTKIHGSRNVRGILWYQGCANTAPEDAAHYGADFAAFVTAVREALGYAIPIFTFQLNREINSPFPKGWSLVKEAQRLAAREIPDVYVLPTMNTPICDEVHNSSHGNVRLGEKMGRLCAHICLGAPEFAAPDIACIELRKDRRLALIFDHVQTELFLYSTNPVLCGFSVFDEAGEVPVTDVQNDEADGSILLLTLAKSPQGQITVSFAGGCNPTMTPPVDEATYLPPLAFYRFQAY